MILRRAAVIATGFAVATSFGLVGAGMAWATAPALKIKPNAIWTIEPKGGGCEQDQFDAANHTFVSDHFSDSGSWSGGGSTLSMTFTAGEDKGTTFSGNFVSITRPAEYRGSATLIGGTVAKTKLVKGAVATFNGVTC
jgi:hypothetical protein